MASFDFINGTLEAGSLTGVTSITTTGGPIATGTLYPATNPSTTLQGITAYVCLVAGAGQVSSSIAGTGQRALYFVNGLLVSSSAAV